jgi:hypothetical protein
MTLATLTTLGRTQMSFDPKAIDAVADHNDTTGRAATCVYGIPPTMLMIDETVQAFVDRLKIAGEFALLTRPNGSPVWIRASSVASIRPPAPGEYDPPVQAIIATPSLTQAVQQSLAQATAAFNAINGKA